MFISKCPLIDGVVKYRAVDSEGEPMGPFIKPQRRGMMSKRNIWTKMGIQNINAINLNAR